jgi:TIR domain-containing protein
MAHDIFISYAHEDKTIADMVCAGLEHAGVRCWLAPRDIQVGADWGGAIVSAIRTSRLMVLVFSDHANSSRHIPRELERAIDLEIPIIPFRIKDVPARGALEYHLSSVHWLDAVTPPIETHIGRLAATLRGMLGDRAEPTPTAAPVTSVPPALSPAGAIPGRARPSGLLVAAGIVIALIAAIGGYILLSNGRSRSGQPPVTATQPQSGSVQPPMAAPSSSVQESPARGAPGSAVNPVEPRSAAPEKPAAGRINRGDSAPATSQKDAATTARCARLNERASVGETLTSAEMAFLTQQCRDRR